MEKSKKFLYIAFSLTTILTLIVLSACAPAHSVFSAGKVKSIYESEDFKFDVELLYTKNPELIEEGEEPEEIYDGIVFSEMPDIDTAYLIKKDGNSALVVVFGVSVMSLDDATVLKGSGYHEAKNNVYICRFKIGSVLATTENRWDLNSPEIIALYSPLKNATPDQIDFGFFGQLKSLH